MSIDQILFFVFAVISILYVLHFGFYLVGANFYGIWQARHMFTRWLSELQGKPKYEPLVTILVPVHNEEAVITRCLESIRLSSYKNLQVLIMNDASTDNTAQLVRDFIKEHPDVKMRLVTKKINVGKGSVLNYGLRRFAKGELVMSLDGDSVIMRNTIENAVAYFSDPRIVGVAANVHIIEEHSVLGVLQKLEHIIGYGSKKVYSLLNCEFVVGGVASTYRMDVLKQVGFYDVDTLTEDIGLSIKVVNMGNRANRIVYGSDVIAMTEGVRNLKALLKQRFRWKYGSLQNLVKYQHLIGSSDKRYTFTLTLYRMPMAVFSEFALLFAPLIWLYVGYVTFGAYSLTLFFGAYVTITMYALLNVWLTEHLTFWERSRMTVYVPLAYFMFYIMDFTQFAAALKCVVRLRKLLLQKDKISKWVSPERIGRKVYLR